MLIFEVEDWSLGEYIVHIATMGPRRLVGLATHANTADHINRSLSVAGLIFLHKCFCHGSLILQVTPVGRPAFLYTPPHIP